MRRTVAVVKPEAQPCPCQDAEQSKDAGTDQSRKEIVADSATPQDGCTGALPDARKAESATTSENVPAATGDGEMKGQCGRSIARPSGVSVIGPSGRADEVCASRTARMPTTWHGEVQRTSVQR